MRFRLFIQTIAIVLLLLAGPPHMLVGVHSSISQDQVILQPSIKRNVYVFFDQFQDTTNSTAPSQITNKLNAINSYFSNVTFGRWTFNWTLFYPSLGQPWYTVNETYAQAGNNNYLAPIFHVINQAYNSGVHFPPQPCCFPATTYAAIIFHAGNSSAITGKLGYDIWPVTVGVYCVGPSTSPECFLGSVIAETDPIGIIIYEMTHLLQQFNEFGHPDQVTFSDPTGAPPSPTMVPSNWDEMWQGLYNGDPRGTRPIEYGTYTRISLGFLSLSQIAVVNKGESSTIALNDLEEPTAGYQGIRIPIRNDTNGYSYFYMVELRRGVSTDYYYPWLTSLFPNRLGMLIWYFRSSMTGGSVNGFLVKAHSWDIGGQTAMFGPCSSTCTPSMSMFDSTNNINVTITSTSNSAFTLQVNNVGARATSCTSPSPSCFLGFLDLDGWSLWLNVILATSLGFALAIAIMRRRRRTQVGTLSPS